MQDECNAVLRNIALSACSRLLTRRFTKRRAVDFMRDGAIRSR